MVGNVECLARIRGYSVVAGHTAGTWREQVGIVSLPEADVHVESRSKSRDFHVVSPLARLAHLLHVLFKLVLQLFLGVIGGVDTSGSRSRGPAFGVSPDAVDSHVLTVEVGIDSHMFNGSGT